MTPDNPTTQANRRYLRGLTITMVCYVVVLAGSIELIERYHLVGTLRWLLVLLPLVPVAFVAVLLARYIRETDEFERRIATESLAVAAGVTAAFSVTYAFLESAGLPHLSAWWTWCVVMGSWLIARLFLSRQYQ